MYQATTHTAKLEREGKTGGGESGKQDDAIDIFWSNSPSLFFVILL